MRILVDTLGSQVQVQFQGGSAPPQRRLNTLLGAMQSSGTSLQLGDPSVKDPLWETCFSCSAIDAAQLDPCQVFFVMTHYYYQDMPVPSFQWTSEELDAITAFVANGGGLLLMSNHMGYPTYDIALAARFGVTLQNVFISNAQGYMQMSGDLLNQGAFEKTVLFGVDSIVAHDGCGISVDPTVEPGSNYTWLAKFPPNAQVGGNPVPDDWYFALHATFGKGQVIVVANSGIVGDYDGAPMPACGQVTAGNNLMFTLNCLRILGGQPQARMLGACPGGQG